MDKNMWDELKVLIKKYFDLLLKFLAELGIDFQVDVDEIESAFNA